MVLIGFAGLGYVDYSHKSRDAPISMAGALPDRKRQQYRTVGLLPS
jgi:hypothetical protein